MPFVKGIAFSSLGIRSSLVEGHVPGSAWLWPRLSIHIIVNVSVFRSVPYGFDFYRLLIHFYLGDVMPLSLFLVKIPLPTWVFFPYKFINYFSVSIGSPLCFLPKTALESQDHFVYCGHFNIFSICEHEILFHLTVSSFLFL